MITDPHQVREELEALLVDLPDPHTPGVDIEVIASRLEQAHDLLVEALQSVERNPAIRLAPGAAVEG